MKKENNFYLVLLFVMMFLTSASIYAQIQQFKLLEREYRYENGKWYILYGGHKGNEIISERLIVRLKDKENLEDFDFHRYNINGVSLGSRRFLMEIIPASTGAVSF